ncbi:MAG TPA: hypothetical protein VGP08_00175 [Pyrinomonadaceae bacterium]|jgi:hypothetical protein|nr:hypothetical protein [Pyrinomonadaceae bacterium]
MRKTLTTAALLLALSCPALAGEMHTPASPTPPTTASATQEPTANGWIQNDSADSLTQTVLDLFALLPSLL